MKITKVEAIWLHVPIAEERQHVTDFGRIASFDTTLVRIETDAGITGHGEARGALSSSSINHAINAVVNLELGPPLVGQDPRRISRIWDEMYNGPRVGLALARGHGFPAMGRRGITLAAISGIDIALWDILGQSLGVPVHQLLGGKRHERMPAYASGGWAPVDGIGAELKGFLDKGDFKAVKMRVGAGDGTLAHSVARVHAAREALGPDIDIMCDAHGTMDVAEAKRFCRQVTDCNIAWFEEPVVGDDKRGLAEIRAATDIPIATGESEFTRFAFRDLLELRAADILQPDVSIAGGITETMRIAALCDAWQVRFAAHLWGGATTFAAGLHISAAVSSAYIIEYSVGANPILQGLAKEDFTAVDGYIEIPDRPGLGVTIDEDFVNEYRFGE